MHSILQMWNHTHAPCIDTFHVAHSQMLTRTYFNHYNIMMIEDDFVSSSCVKSNGIMSTQMKDDLFVSLPIRVCWCLYFIVV